MARATALTPLGVAALSLLVEEPMHPYEMYQLLIARHEDRLVKVRPGTLYHAVGRLEEQGLVTATGTDREGNRPERTTYTISAAGREALTRGCRTCSPPRSTNTRPSRWPSPRPTTCRPASSSNSSTGGSGAGGAARLPGLRRGTAPEEGRGAQVLDRCPVPAEHAARRNRLDPQPSGPAPLRRTAVVTPRGPRPGPGRPHYTAHPPIHTSP